MYSWERTAKNEQFEFLPTKNPVTGHYQVISAEQLLYSVFFLSSITFCIIRTTITILIASYICSLTMETGHE